MNNYYNYKNYMNQAKQMNHPLAQPKENIQNQMPVQKKEPTQKQDIPNIYDPYEGFIRGNMFQDLYEPYKIRTPYEIRPINEQAELLTNIDALGFAMIDLNLYLDIYPNNKEMIQLYNEYRVYKQELTDQYEKKFGPLLTSSDALNTSPWAWIAKPWPWETK
ncbi:MAG: spore coat protein CotJB [Bacilli bacterium]|nr:spore coat protein CotJB [Bacilli bacterium]